MKYKAGPVVEKKEKDSTVYFTIHWSNLYKVEKYFIINSVPSVAGIFELYYMDEKKKLVLMFVSRVWYGGLRTRLRRITDPELTEHPKRKQLLENRSCYFRYTISQSFADMQDILFFFAGRYVPGVDAVQHSGRYEEIFIEEISADKITTI